MGIIKIGDRVTVPSKNVKGEIAFIGKTHFAIGTWIGIILDEPLGKHNETIIYRRYFSCPRNHGMFINASNFERECVIDGAVDKHGSLHSEKQQYPNSLKPAATRKTDSCKTVDANHKKKLQFQNKNSSILDRGNILNINGKDTETSEVSECGGTSDASDKGNFNFIRRYPNYLKASSKLIGSHFCLNKTKDAGSIHHEETVCNHTDKKLIDRFDYLGKVEKEAPKRIIYPNYLKASSKLTRSHFCLDKNKENANIHHQTHVDDQVGRIKTGQNVIDRFYYLGKSEIEFPKRVTYPNYLKASSKLSCKHFCWVNYNDISDGEMRDVPRKAEMQTLKSYEDNNKHFANFSAYLLNYPYHLETFLNIGKNHPGSSKSIETSNAKALSDKCDPLILKDYPTEKICDKNTEIEEMKHDIKSLQIKLKSMEISLQEAVEKYDEAQRELKYLKFQNECQRKQIKCLKDQLKLLQISQANNSKADYLGTNKNPLEQNNIGDTLNNAHNDYDNNHDNDMHTYVLELEEKNKIMVQGLLELRDFFKSQKLWNIDNDDQFPYTNIRTETISESFSLHPDINPNVFNSDKMKGYFAISREMTKFGELMNEEIENVEKWDGSIEDKNSLPRSYLNSCDRPAVQSTENYSNCVDSSSKFDMDPKTFQNSPTFKKNKFQNNDQTATISRNSRNFLRETAERAGMVNQHLAGGDEMPTELSKCVDELSHQIPSLAHDKESSFSSTTLNEDVHGKDIDGFVENYGPRKKVLSKFPMDSGTASSATLPKSKSASKKMSVSIERGRVKNC